MACASPKRTTCAPKRVPENAAKIGRNVDQTRHPNVAQKRPARLVGTVSNRVISAAPPAVLCAQPLAPCCAKRSNFMQHKKPHPSAPRLP
ncbi:hypothetical protein NDU88_002718 [Pleurodeles waltl]|uniref:Uncharacterized protein n=1 Tax=Pleurodeles waltl TaxID=8319 RepID=A0AAV7M474_PLEWA|nr:hypothetical protein NDU88_002718 [Pleurodeles waltl]